MIISQARQSGAGLRLLCKERRAIFAPTRNSKQQATRAHHYYRNNNSQPMMNYKSACRPSIVHILKFLYSV
jgi:hypothetical protein